MTPHYVDPLVTLFLGDCVTVMAELEAESVDSVVCDPPYNLAFMGREWDKNLNHGPWATEAFRVLKPGGYLLAFGGTRTYHRLASAIEDAGFEIRDTLMWIYASGFPKSLDVSKALDKVAGAEREVTGQRDTYTGADKATNWKNSSPRVMDVTAPATDLARKWEGWGTALKPAHEPIVMARKPLVGTVAGNITRYGTGAINVDACRIPGTEAQEYTVKRLKPGATLNKTGGNWRPEDGPEYHGQTKAGRWPSNVMLGDPELFDEPNPWVVGSGATAITHPGKVQGGATAIYGSDLEGEARMGPGDSGGYSRFFRVPERPRAGTDDEATELGRSREYPSAFIVPKADRTERNRGLTERSSHPTVKPIDLMRHLVRLVTPPGGVTLDPFLGSGTTALAASEEGFRCIGIEREAEYLSIAVGRLMATPMGLGLDVPAGQKRRTLGEGTYPKGRAYSRGGSVPLGLGTDEEPAA